MTLVDSNVLLDVFGDDPSWARWSTQQLDIAAERGAVMINEVVYAELAAGFARIEELDGALARGRVTRVATPAAALFVAGQVFRRHRAVGDVRTSLLPDFFIGAHAHVTSLPLLTRDTARYRTYFPDVQLITP